VTATRHRQVVVPYDGGTVEVDEGMADLLAVVWAHGVRTTASCETDRDGLASVSFESPADATTFCNLATDADTPDLPDTWECRGWADNRARDTYGQPDHVLRLTLRLAGAHRGRPRLRPRHTPAHTRKPLGATWCTPWNRARCWLPQGRGAGRGGT
jgi:hypothetical protein